MTEKYIRLVPESKKKFTEQIENKFKQKTEWSEFVEELLSKNETPTLEEFLFRSKSIKLDS